MAIQHLGLCSEVWRSGAEQKKNIYLVGNPPRFCSAIRGHQKWGETPRAAIQSIHVAGSILVPKDFEYYAPPEEEGACVIQQPVVNRAQRGVGDYYGRSLSTPRLWKTQAPCELDPSRKVWTFRKIPDRLSAD